MKFIWLLVVFFVFTGNINAVHPIQIRQAANGTGGEFYDVRTNIPFVPRGINDRTESSTNFGNDRPGVKYSPAATEKMFSQLSSLGYNTIRIFIGREIASSTNTLSKIYLNNFKDYLVRAKAHNIYIMPTIWHYPEEYFPEPQPTGRDLYNLMTFNQLWIDGKKRFLIDFINGLKAINAPMETIFAYSLTNEFKFITADGNGLPVWPFSIKSGILETPAGTFDMTNEAGRREMMDKNLSNSTQQYRETIRSRDTDALVTMGFFPIPAIGEKDWELNTRWIFKDPEVGGSPLDFVDIHFYKPYGTYEEQMRHYSIVSRKKPIIFGEWGAKMGVDYVESIKWYRDFQVNSCQKGIRGWLVWSWTENGITFSDKVNTTADINNEFNKLLAPANRANPCAVALATPKPTSNQKVGDYDKNGRVDMLDFAYWKTKYLSNLMTLYDFMIWKIAYLNVI